MSKMLLFDVDQTLLSTKGGDRKALDIAFHQLFGIADAFGDISFAGRMDMDILGEAFRRWGIDRAEASDTMTRFQETYVRLLEKILPGWTEGHAYPGVRQLLETLSRREDVYLGLIRATSERRLSSSSSATTWISTFLKEDSGATPPNEVRPSPSPSNAVGPRTTPHMPKRISTS